MAVVCTRCRRPALLDRVTKSLKNLGRPYFKCSDSQCSSFLGWAVGNPPVLEPEPLPGLQRGATPTSHQAHTGAARYQPWAGCVQGHQHPSYQQQHEQQQQQQEAGQPRTYRKPSSVQRNVERAAQQVQGKPAAAGVPPVIGLVSSQHDSGRAVAEPASHWAATPSTQSGSFQSNHPKPPAVETQPHTQQDRDSPVHKPLLNQERTSSRKRKADESDNGATAAAAAGANSNSVQRQPSSQLENGKSRSRSVGVGPSSLAAVTFFPPAAEAAAAEAMAAALRPPPGVSPPGPSATAKAPGRPEAALEALRVEHARVVEHNRRLKENMGLLRDEGIDLRSAIEEMRCAAHRAAKEAATAAATAAAAAAAAAQNLQERDARIAQLQKEAAQLHRTNQTMQAEMETLRRGQQRHPEGRWFPPGAGTTFFTGQMPAFPPPGFGFPGFAFPPGQSAGTSAGARPSMRSSTTAGGGATPAPNRAPTAFTAAFPGPWDEAPALDDLSSVRELKEYVAQAGAAAQAALCAEKNELLALAKARANAWEIRRILACSQLPEPLRYAAVFRTRTVPPPNMPPAPSLMQMYRTLVLRVHPDKNHGDPEATTAFQLLQEAYSRMAPGAGG